jgi:ascorbate-specific PTS system EIIC-type component UlaA
VTIHIPSFIKFNLNIQKLIRGGYTDTQDGNRISLLLFLFNIMKVGLKRFRKYSTCFPTNHYNFHNPRTARLLLIAVYDIITVLINALPSNSSVNTVQHATIEEAVFSVSAVTSHNSGFRDYLTCFL